MNRIAVPGPILPQWAAAPQWVDGRMRLPLAGREYVLRREADMESLWEGLGQDGFGADERMPYWAELWPASLLLAAWLEARPEELAGRRCLDLGCGMGLSAMAGAAAGARVLGVDHQPAAVAHGLRNARENGLPAAFAVMDWRAPALAEGMFDLLWGSDILYETRFYEPLTAIFRSCLAPGGRVVLAEPWREVSRGVWDRLAADGFAVARLHEESVAVASCRSTISLYEIRP
ncbi:class I SAM-dependent methyltransferase [Solidesulfovibrio carbinolicus]|uniref:Methyltransferase type 11 n=1 Tax=Solidesulfovibrio carbinolicus TaxID=296842 RepID=A0A4P6HI87_9BACT|nr:methyltransferase domain-containing protein [Solidesulfovibrio carbinolicus]QAZ66861.1 methyltransferase type 11 [Solidesulfovibrio carbinolicus]